MSTTTRLSSRAAAAFITARRALATRPPRPITRPRSSSATSSSSTTSPSISSTSVTLTALGSATSARARNSSRSRTARLAAGGLDALGAKQRRDGPRRLGALLQPVLGAIAVDRDQGRVRLRVVLADRLDRAAVARRARIGHDDPPDRVLLGSDSSQAYANHRPGRLAGRRPRGGPTPPVRPCPSRIPWRCPCPYRPCMCRRPCRP